jgi:hypothetical protein
MSLKDDYYRAKFLQIITDEACREGNLNPSIYNKGAMYRDYIHSQKRCTEASQRVIQFAEECITKDNSKQQ